MCCMAVVHVIMHSVHVIMHSVQCLIKPGAFPTCMILNCYQINIPQNPNLHGVMRLLQPHLLSSK